MELLKINAPKAFSAVLLASAVVLTGCTGDDESASTASAPAQQSTMDVKQPEPAVVEKAPLAEAAAKVEEKTEETKVVVEEKTEEVAAVIEEKTEEATAAAEEAVAEVSAPAGKDKYSSCAGCHGTNGEGGVGPALNSQSADEIVAKLKKYKAGEQLGPMTGMMAPLAQALSEEDMQAIADYISAK